MKDARRGITWMVLQNGACVGVMKEINFTRNMHNPKYTEVSVKFTLSSSDLSEFTIKGIAEEPTEAELVAKLRGITCTTCEGTGMVNDRAGGDPTVPHSDYPCPDCRAEEPKPKALSFAEELREI